MKAIVAGIMIIGLMALTGCQEETGGPSTSDYKAERSKRLALSKQHRAEEKPGESTKAPKQGKGEDKLVASAMGGAWNPEGKRDPFRSFILEEARLKVGSTRGPLENFDLGQLDVQALVWQTRDSRALIKDPSGRAYIVAEGARVGRNEGEIVKIDDNVILVKEKYVDFLGEETTKDIKMQVHGR